MLFNSVEFIFFLPAVAAVFFILPHKYRWILLLAASYFFYMYWKAEYIILIAASTLTGYFTAFGIASAENRTVRKVYLIISLLINLGILAVFKYAGFLTGIFSDILSAFTNNAKFEPIKMLLPVGISFYTFQILSYSLDVYRERRKPEKHLGVFALYVSFFPQLVAGPIERSTTLLPQFFEKKEFNYKRIHDGMAIVLTGLFKKIVVADRLALIVDHVYKDPHNSNGIQLLIGTLFFAVQVYLDFSAYSDIAIGSAKIFGYDLMENFKRPFIAKNVTDFWRRWHISLSTWINDYLYNPLVISMRNLGKAGIITALIITFVLVGLWHGPDWQWALFGVIHGVALGFEFVTRKLRKRLSQSMPGKIYLRASILLTLFYIVFSFIFFRAESTSDAFYIAGHLFSDISLNAHLFSPEVLNCWSVEYLDANLPELLLCIALVLCTFLIEWKRKSDHNIHVIIKSKKRMFRAVLYVLMIAAILVFGIFEHTAFVYFQF